MKTEINTRQLAIGFTVLALGAIFYYFFRPVEHTYFLQLLENNPNKHTSLAPLYVTIGNSLPTFIHVLAFALITAGLITRQKMGYMIVCLFWFTVDALFEVGQALTLNETIIKIIPNWFSDFLILENSKNYFLHGHYDWFDMLSIALGSMAAYVLLIKTRHEGEKHERKITFNY